MTLTHGQQILYRAGKRALDAGRSMAEVRRKLRSEIREATRGLHNGARESLLVQADEVIELLEAQRQAVPS